MNSTLALIINIPTLFLLYILTYFTQALSGKRQFYGISLNSDYFNKDEFKNLEGNKFMNDIVSIEKIIEKNPQKNKWNIDTVLINKILMKEEGLKPENIIDSGICSMCNSDIIHSYRVEKENYKTEAALIELK